MRTINYPDPHDILIIEQGKFPETAISPEMAERLDQAFGGGAETWLKLQAR